jgi:UDP-N-acetylmuramyl pentapeptide phosphotransferase/UDP-N-acetylglucosamine-1-phosphate transferase
MNITFLIIFIILLFVIELVYFRIADRFNLTDHPNHRSSHTKVTITGGGIIFSLSLIIAPLFFGLEYDYFLTGLCLVGIVSFIDDVRPIRKRIRITIHLIAVSLLFQQLHLYHLPLYWVIGGFILFIGTINAINFMDGINGITGGYSLVAILTLLYINKEVVVFTDEKQLIISAIAVLVFLVFNFRKKAKCFAGDVGSVSIAFILLFFILQLIIKTKDLNYLLLLLMYGMDTATTIIFRFIRKENIFEAHRTHFYQYLVNEKKISHLSVASLYMVVQAIINVLIISFLSKSGLTFVLALIVSTALFLFVRLKTEGKNRLINRHK